MTESKIAPGTIIDIAKRNYVFKMPSAHFHDHHELYHLKSGKVKYFIGNDIYVLNPGDFIFVPKNKFHKTDSEEAKDVERIVLYFKDESLSDDYKKILDMLNREIQLEIDKEKLYKFYEIYSRMEGEITSKKEYSDEMEGLYLKQILILLARYSKKSDDKNLNDTQLLIREAARYISTNCNEPLTLNTVAKKFALSPFYFSKLFGELTGIGFSEYLNVARISLAKALISQGCKNMTKLSESCGFTSSSYFIQVFKKLCGVTPKKYSMQFLK